MLAPFVLLAALSPPPGVAVSAAAVVRLESAEIRLGDVADLRALPSGERTRLASRLIARMPPGRSRLSLTRSAVAGLIRRSVPGLAVAGGEGEILFEALPIAPAVQLCAATNRPVSAGAALAAEDLDPAPCTERVLGPVRYDPKAGTVVALADLPAGANLGVLRVEPAPAVAAGESLTLVSRAGPVSVAREVVALQPGRAGGRVFVRDADGTVISAPVAERAEAKP